MANQDMQTVTTGRVRLSYVHLFTPHATHQGQEPKYSTTILIPKGDVATKQKIDMAIQAATQQGVSSLFNGVRPPVLPIPIHDGDGVRPSDGTPYGDECKGHWVLTSASKQQPEVVDLNMNRILNQSEIYSGVYARVNIRFYPYVNSGKKGIACGLGPVQKLEDGEPLGGKISAASAFGEPTGFQQSVQQYQAPMQPTPQYQQPYQQPVQQYTPPPQQYQAPIQQPVQPAPQYQQPYQQPVQQYAPQQPAQPMQIDPITGRPIAPGGIMGI